MDSKRPDNDAKRRPALVFVWLIVLASIAPTIAGVLGRFAWWLDGWNAFPVHAVIAAAIGGVIAAAIRAADRGRWAAVGVAAAVAVFGTWQVLKESGRFGVSLAASAGDELDLMLANVHTSNRDFDRFLRVVHEDPPDVLAVLETDAGWVTALETLSDEYPHRFAIPRGDNFGVALLSKRLFASVREADFGQTPSIEAVVEVGERPLTVIVTHPVPPKGDFNWRSRNEQMAAIADYVSRLEGEAVVAGDLNTPPWSPFYADLKRDGGLRDGRHRGSGLSTTWPATTWWLRTPIDHVLATEGVRFNRYEVGPKTGSDHLPVRAVLAVE